MLWKEGNTQKQFTIGPYPTISLKEAREKRDADRDDAEDREKPALGFPDLPQRVFQ